MSPLVHPLKLRTLHAALCVCVGAALVANHAPGYQTSQQAAVIAGGFTHTSQNAGGHIAAGGSIGGNYNYSGINTPFGGGGTFHAAGGLQAGYRESSYANTLGVAGGFEASEASGQGKVWGYKASEGSGNLGINIAEGISNAQSNDVSLASVDIGNVFGNAQIFSTQSSSGTARINNFNLNASIGDGSLSGVTGNVGVNVASGIGNVQNNSLAGAVTTTKPGNALTTAMVATDDNSQTAGMTVTGQFQGTAMLGSNALANASGNIGVNIAGGAGNLQHNGLAIAALNSGH